MCNMKQAAMERAGEMHSAAYYDTDRNMPVVPAATQKPSVYDATALMALTQQMVDLGRMLEGGDGAVMIQAAAVLEALGRLPVVDPGVQAELLKSLRAELADKEAQAAHLASKLADAQAVVPKADPEWPAGEQEAYRLGAIAGRAAPASAQAVPVAGSVGDANAKENAVQQAQNWAMEAKTQRGIVISILKALGLPEQDYNALPLVLAHIESLKSTPQTAPAAPSVDRNAVKRLIEAGALRQYRRNDGSTTGVVFGYDKAITDRFIASLTAPVAQPLAPSGAVLGDWSVEWEKFSATAGLIRVSSAKWGGCFLPSPAAHDIGLHAIMYRFMKDYLAAQPLAASAVPTAADYEEVLADHRRLVRQLDVALNGVDGAAKQASLGDIVRQVEREGIRASRQEVQQAAQAVTEGSLRDAVTILRGALVQAECAIKGREHTGFITKALNATSSVLAAPSQQPAASPSGEL